MLSELDSISNLVESLAGGVDEPEDVGDSTRVRCARNRKRRGARFEGHLVQVVTGKLCEAVQPLWKAQKKFAVMASGP